MDIAELVASLPFVKNHGIEIVSLEGGRSVLRMPFDPAFATPPALFPASMVGLIGDVAAVSACQSLAPAGHACATLDYTLKMTGPAAGQALVAEGRVLQAGKTLCVGAADVYVIDRQEKRHCGAVLATARVHEIRGQGS